MNIINLLYNIYSIIENPNIIPKPEHVVLIVDLNNVFYMIEIPSKLDVGNILKVNNYKIYNKE